MAAFGSRRLDGIFVIGNLVSPVGTRQRRFAARGNFISLLKHGNLTQKGEEDRTFAYTSFRFLYRFFILLVTDLRPDQFYTGFFAP